MTWEDGSRVRRTEALSVLVIPSAPHDYGCFMRFTKEELDDIYWGVVMAQ
jgi:hypothetical protein